MFIALKTLRLFRKKFNSPKLLVLLRVTSLKRAPPLHCKKPLLAGWNVAREQALHLGESREVTLGQHAKGDASARGALPRVFSRLASLAIIGKLARKLGEKEAQDTLTNHVIAKLYLRSTLKRQVNKSITQQIYLLINY